MEHEEITHLIAVQDIIDQCYFKMTALTEILNQEPTGPAWQGVGYIFNEISEDLYQAHKWLKELRGDSSPDIGSQEGRERCKPMPN